MPRKGAVPGVFAREVRARAPAPELLRKLEDARQAPSPCRLARSRDRGTNCVSPSQHPPCRMFIKLVHPADDDFSPGPTFPPRSPRSRARRPRVDLGARPGGSQREPFPNRSFPQSPQRSLTCTCWADSIFAGQTLIVCCESVAARHHPMAALKGAGALATSVKSVPD